MNDSEELEDLDNLVKNGYIRAECPSCGIVLESIYIKECDICKSKIDMDRIRLEVIDWDDCN